MDTSDVQCVSEQRSYLQHWKALTGLGGVEETWARPGLLFLDPLCICLFPFEYLLGLIIAKVSVKLFKSSAVGDGLRQCIDGLSSQRPN